MDGLNTTPIIDELQKLIDGINAGEFIVKNITMARGIKSAHEGEYVTHAATNERNLTICYIEKNHD